MPVTGLSPTPAQPGAWRAAEVCAAGGHHLSLLGPDQAGKAVLARHVVAILPPLSARDALEVAAIGSVAGTLPAQAPLLPDPPFQAPHNTASKTALIGGGSGVLRPGAASLAHNGVLFLEEAPAFGRDVLDALRQPLETGEVVLARGGITARFPARFILVIAARPCPCTSPAGTCTCPPAVRSRYLGRVSGPLLDRVDVKIRLQPPERTELLTGHAPGACDRGAAERVAAARDRAARRLRGTGWQLNSQIPGSELRRTWPPAPGAR